MPAVLSLVATTTDVLSVAWPTVLSVLLTFGLLLGLRVASVRQGDRPRGTRRRLSRVSPESKEHYARITAGVSMHKAEILGVLYGSIQRIDEAQRLLRELESTKQTVDPAATNLTEARELLSQLYRDLAVHRLAKS